MRRTRKPSLLMVLLLLTGGAIINVAVAWWCAQYSSKTLTLDNAAVLAFLSADMPVDGSRPFRYQAFSHEGFGTLIQGRPGDNPFHQILVMVSVGWPCQSLQSWTQKNGDVWRQCAWHIPLANTPSPLWVGFPYKHELPLCPLWPGFAINTVFYAAILWLLCAALHPEGFARRRIRARRGQCPACAYPIGTSDVCTECGKAVKTKAIGNGQ